MDEARIGPRKHAGVGHLFGRVLRGHGSEEQSAQRQVVVAIIIEVDGVIELLQKLGAQLGAHRCRCRWRRGREQSHKGLLVFAQHHVAV